MKRLILGFIFSLFITSAFAQAVGQLGAGQAWGNPTSGQRSAKGTLIGPLLDQGYTCTAQGSILQRGASVWTCTAPGATANTPLITNGTGANLSYGPFSLPGTPTSGGVLCFTSASVSASSVLQTANAIMLGGGAGVCPSPLGSLGTTTTVLHGNASGAPSFTSVVFADLATGAVATQAQYIAGTASTLVASNIAYTSEQTTTFGTTTSFDFSTFINTSVTLTGNITTMNVSNIKAGQAGQIRFIQDGTGSRTTVWNSVFKFAGGTTPVLTTATPNAVDVLFYSCTDSTHCWSSMTLNMK